MYEEKLVNSDVMLHLKKYNNRELFYQQYSSLCQNKEALKNFLGQYNPADLRKDKIFLEEILPKTCEEFEGEESMWDNEEASISIEKYSRFMPYLYATHNFFEIVYIVDNNMHLDIGGNNIPLHSGDICFLSPGTLHCPQVSEHTIALQMTVRKSTFRQEFFRCLTGSSLISEFFLNALYLQNAGNVILFHMESEEEIKNIFFQLYLENYNKSPGYQNIMNNLFEILLFYLLRCDTSRIELLQTCPKSEPRITKILQYIENNCQRITIAELSENFHLSKSYLSKYITQKTGKTFSYILQEIRLEKARKMLCSSNLRVNDISETVGYQNVEHFIRLFKNKYRKTPTHYRKENSSLLKVDDTSSFEEFDYDR